MEKSDDTGKIIGALLLGAAIGGALGILFAPGKGSETRKKLTEDASDLTNLLKENFDTVIEEAKQEFKTSIKKACTPTESAKEDLKSQL